MYVFINCLNFSTTIGVENLKKEFKKNIFHIPSYLHLYREVRIVPFAQELVTLVAQPSFQIRARFPFLKFLIL